MVLASDMDIPVFEESLTRSDLYIADEMFLTGTAAELTPVASLDERSIGGRGPITKQIQDRLFDVVAGKVEEYQDWLTEV